MNTESRHTVIWRSMLFVPAHVEKYVQAAHQRNADAVILDLEDSVPADQKVAARQRLAKSVGTVAQSGTPVIVRINAESDLMAADIDAAVHHGVRALMVPKVDSPATLQALSSLLSALEQARDIADGHILLIAQIEHVRALSQMDAIAASTPRLLGMILGSEDFSVSAGMEPLPETLYAPNQQLVFACRRAGILPFGFPGSISVFRDLDLFRQIIQRAREMGFVGAYAIHPNQVLVMNELFAPTAAEVAHARELLAAYDEAAALGRGALDFRGRMVDMPVVLRARELLRRADAIRPS
jgi:citrate lyase subunit beta/citryl-CoA lyase